VGQDVVIRLDAYFENQFEGKITEISPISTNIGGVVSFELIVKPDTAGVPTLLYGLSASLDIVTSSAEDVLYVPIQSVFEENGKSYVSIPGEDGSIKKVEVSTGLYNFDFIEIKSGLDEGDFVLISPIQ
jgi:HlyD family secretion protein